MEPIIEIKQTVSSYCTEVKLAKGEEISRVLLDGYKSPSGGYLNWAEFKIVGLNPKTNRKNTRKIKATEENEAIKIAEKELQNPSVSTTIPHIALSDYDKESARDYGFAIPEGACSADISCIIDRITNYDKVLSERWISDDTKLLEVVPSPAANECLAKFAHNRGIHFSMYIREENLLSSLFYELDDYNKAAFVAFYVLRSINNTFMGNDEELNKFADFAVDNSSLMKSIRERDVPDYYKPNKKSAAYKAVLKFFDIN